MSRCQVVAQPRMRWGRQEEWEHEQQWVLQRERDREHEHEHEQKRSKRQMDMPELIKDISELQAKLEQQADVDPPPEDELLQRWMFQLYEIACDLVHHSPRRAAPHNTGIQAEKAILAVWDQLLQAIRCLAAIRHRGPYMASRMALFAMLAFLHKGAGDRKRHKKERDVQKLLTLARLGTNYAFRLDECLLSCLRKIWDDSRGTERFYWTTTFMSRELESWENELMITRLCPYEPPPFESTGPLPKRHMAYRGRDPSGNKLTTWGKCLHRSYQFVLDARQLLHHRGSGRRIVVDKLLTQHKVPPEIQLYIAESSDLPKAHPYLSRFNISDAYLPFPIKSDGECDVCGEGKGRPKAGAAARCRARTCQQKSVTIWNSGLRAFHTFHETRSKSMAMCRRADICDGHHADDGWAITTDTDLVNHVRCFVRRRCGGMETMTAVGLGPLWTPDDAARRRTLAAHCGYGPHDEFVCIAQNKIHCQLRRPGFGVPWSHRSFMDDIQGGAFGVIAMMLHPEVVMMNGPRGRSWVSNDRPRSQAAWIRGRDVVEELEAGIWLQSLHREGSCNWPDYCSVLRGYLRNEGDLAIKHVSRAKQDKRHREEMRADLEAEVQRLRSSGYVCRSVSLPLRDEEEDEDEDGNEDWSDDGEDCSDDEEDWSDDNEDWSDDNEDRSNDDEHRSYDNEDEAIQNEGDFVSDSDSSDDENRHGTISLFGMQYPRVLEVEDIFEDPVGKYLPVHGAVEEEVRRFFDDILRPRR